MSAAPDTTPAPGPATPGPSADAARRAGLRVDVARAARLVGPVWPLDRFVAVNPLVGLVGLGFDAAVAEAGRWLRAEGYPGAGVVRQAVADGALTAGDLERAAAEVLGDRCGRPWTDATGTTVTAPALVAADVVDGPSLPTRPPAPRSAAERLDARTGGRLAEAVDAEVARWCALLATGSVPGTDDPGPDAYARWRSVAPLDRRLRRLVGAGGRTALAAVPGRADDAVLVALDRLGIAEGDRVDELRGQLARLPGWAGWARWCDEWAGPDRPRHAVGLLDLLALRLTVESLAVDAAVGSSVAPSTPDRTAVPAADDGAGRTVAALAACGLAAEPGAVDWAASVLAPVDRTARGRIALAALEGATRRRLLGSLDRPTPGPADPVAQVVLCIDGRSEVLRRHLEATGPYDTLGFAGFFALPMRFRPVGSSESYPSAPVILDPDREVPEVGVGAPGPAADRHAAASASAAVEGMAHGPLSLFTLADAGGWLLGPAALGRTLLPRARGPEAPATTLPVDGVAGGGGFSLEERVLVAETALRTMGLTRSFAPLVVLCGHGSTSAANPHAAALDCGACGGHRGGPNARAVASVVNDPAVRDGLRSRGIDVPAGTWFVAAEHDTTLDEVTVLDRGDLPAGHLELLARLESDLAVAAERTAAERLRRLEPRAPRPGRARARARRRAGDWAETRPEWGLAGNAAFVVATRDRTRQVDLGGRSFLHSYDRDADLDGTVLETILTGPLVVAQWINAQYYFSTVDPGRFGAGDKTLHNPVGTVGVVEGTGGDLRGGLPWQSVARGDRFEHLPVRLLTVLDAPVDRVDAVVGRNPGLRDLVDGGWLHVVTTPDPGGPWRARHPDGSWRAVPDPIPTTLEVTACAHPA